MKVLCLYSDCGPSFVRTGWGNVFLAMGHEFHFWDNRSKPAHDVFNEVEPDLYLGTTYDLDRAVYECLLDRPEMKVALYSSAWGELVDDIDEEEFPITRVTLGEQQRVTRLFAEVNKPDLIFSHVPEPWLEGVLGSWRETGAKIAGVLNAADTVQYRSGQRKEEFVSDISFVGGYWPYKARNLDPYLLPLCEPQRGLRVKIWGNQPWPVAQYLGLASEEDVPDMMASASICPSISEPHSTTYHYDLIERLFKVPVMGGFVISDRVGGIDHVFGKDVFPQASSPDEFHDMIKYFLARPEQRIAIMEKERQVVLNHHTYFHRVHQILSEIGMMDEAGKALLCLVTQENSREY